MLTETPGTEEEEEEPAFVQTIFPRIGSKFGVHWAAAIPAVSNTKPNSLFMAVSLVRRLVGAPQRKRRSAIRPMRTSPHRADVGDDLDLPRLRGRKRLGRRDYQGG